MKAFFLFLFIITSMEENELNAQSISNKGNVIEGCFYSTDFCSRLKDSSYLFISGAYGNINDKMNMQPENWDIGITKVKRDGKVVWNTIYKDSTIEKRFKGACIDSDENVYFVYEAGYMIANYSCVLVVVDKKGEIENKFEYNLDPNGITQSKDGGFFIYGSTLVDSSGSDSIKNEIVKGDNIVNANLTIHYRYRLVHNVLIKIDNEGNILWSKFYSRSLGMGYGLNNVKEDYNGDIYFTEWQYDGSSKEHIVYANSKGGIIVDRVLRDSIYFIKWSEDGTFYCSKDNLEEIYNDTLKKYIEYRSITISKESFHGKLWAQNIFKRLPDVYTQYQTFESKDGVLFFVVPFKNYINHIYGISSDGYKMDEVTIDTCCIKLRFPMMLDLGNNSILIYGTISNPKSQNTTYCGNIYFGEMRFVHK